MSINAGTIMAELVLNTDQYEAGIKKAEKQANNFANKMKEAGEKISKFGKDMTLKVTTPLVTMGTIATKAAIDFESAFAGVRKTVDASEEEFAKLEKGIRDMSKEIPASAVAIAGVAEAAGQLGIETDNILSFSRTMIDLGEATNLSADEAATALARLANITGMSQKDFDRLGSVIVDLGNNLATTEAEIVAMGMRLAGAGKQIGFTEAQTMAFAGALSSVGIEAEAGGSSFSRLMVDMQLAVETGNENLKSFAEVAGMSGKDFQKAFQEDAAGALITFVQGLSTSEERGISAIKVLDDIGITEIRLRDALLRAAGASEVFIGALDLGTKAWEENTALTKEAEQRYKTSASQIEIAKNNLKDAGITIGEMVVPHLVTLAEKVKEASEWFANLNPNTQETIVKFTALAAAIGPAVLLGVKMVTGISKIASLFTKVVPIVKIATTATTALSGGIGAAGTAASAGAMLLNPWVLGVTAATVGGIALYKHLNQEAIPAVNLFGEDVSEATQKAVGGFLELHDEADTALKQLYWSSAKVTTEMSETISGNFARMGEQIRGGLARDFDESKAILQDFFRDSENISIEEQQKILEDMESGYQERRQKVTEGEARIKEILNKASQEKRALTRSEKAEINQIQEEMVETGIRVLSESEKEQHIILSRMKNNAETLSAKQAAEVVKNSKEQANKTIKEAERQRDEIIAELEYQRDELGTISYEQAEKLIEEARRQYDETVNNAERMHNDVVKFAKEQAGEHVHQVDWETGEVKTKWQVMRDDVSKKVSEIKDNVLNKYNELRVQASEIIENKKTAIIEKWETLKESAYTWAGNMMEMFKKGITDREAAIADAVEGVGNKIKEYLGFASPTKAGALSDSDKWMPNFIQMLADGISKNSDKVKSKSEDLAQKIGDSLSKVNNYVTNTVGVIEKQFQLWVLQNNVAKDSSAYLAQQLEVQKQKHELLNAQIDATNNALERVAAKYGEGSARALEYQNKLLDLKIAQAELGNEIENTTKTIAKQTDELTNWISKVANLGKDAERVAKGLSSRDKNKVYESALVISLTQEWEKTGTIKIGKNARGTDYWRGGLTWVGEEGPELISLPGGSKIFSNANSLQIAMDALKSLSVNKTIKRNDSTSQGSNMATRGGDIHQHITINSPSPLTPSEIARKNLQVSRQLAMEWGF